VFKSSTDIAVPGTERMLQREVERERACAGVPWWYSGVLQSSVTGPVARWRYAARLPVLSDLYLPVRSPDHWLY